MNGCSRALAVPFALWIMLFGIVVGAHAEQLSLAPSRDTSIFALNPDNGNGAGVSLFVGAILSGEPQRSLIRFDLSALPPSALVTSATLAFSITAAGGSSGSADPISLHRVTTDWGEGTANNGTRGGGQPASPTDATWRNRFHGPVDGNPNLPWTTNGAQGDYAILPSSAMSVSAIGNYVFPSTPQLIADLQAWLHQPTSNFGWIMLGAEGVPQSARRIASREATNAAQRPVLTVTYTVPAPTPNTVPSLPLWATWLLAGGLLMIATRRQRL